jgi:hypothetical protein
MEIDAHPESFKYRRMSMKMKGPVLEVSFEGLDEKDRLGILGRHLFDCLGVQQAEPDRLQRRLLRAMQKLFHRSKLVYFSKTADRAVLIPDDYPMCIYCLSISTLRH